jgi:hypothetical protein
VIGRPAKRPPSEQANQQEGQVRQHVEGARDAEEDALIRERVVLRRLPERPAEHEPDDETQAEPGQERESPSTPLPV